MVFVGKAGVGVQVNTVLPALQADEVESGVKDGDAMNVTIVAEVSIAWLKVKTTAAEGETPVAKSPGTVETMVGCAAAGKRPQREATITTSETRRRQSAGRGRQFVFMVMKGFGRVRFDGRWRQVTRILFGNSVAPSAF